MEKLNEYGLMAWDGIIQYAPKVLIALVILWIGLRIIKWVVGLLDRQFERKNTDPTLRPFLKSIIGAILKVMLFISVISMLGVETTSFIAILGAAGLAVGLALQGTLANFAGGVLLLLFKPYKVGDLIEAQGHIGVVKEIQIFVTIINTPDNKTVFIPNGAMSNGDITNFTIEGKIRVELTPGISYNADIKKAKDICMEVLNNHPKVLKDPAPFVGVKELADSAVVLAVFPHAKPEHYWDVYFEITEQVKLALDANNVPIPFPQMDVHMHGAEKLAGLANNN
ncbi:MAG: mechanosensitive ion channel family protein [Bacteroidia bacterium]|nr:mechanosensitive ion channel family protein [Bacteroidia bacterium]NNC85287.1 mechanosensitive ion channel family protein [Bacteroidia bacterium]NNM16589.1 mechanosensitive ion channel family protein [Bacteroidia bacterium]